RGSRLDHVWDWIPPLGYQTGEYGKNTQGTNKSFYLGLSCLACFSNVIANTNETKKKWWLVSESMYVTCTTVVRLSIGTFLLRIAMQLLHRRIIFAVMAASSTACVYLLLLLAFQCKPVSFFWNKNQSGTCINPIVI